MNKLLKSFNKPRTVLCVAIGLTVLAVAVGAVLFLNQKPLSTDTTTATDNTLTLKEWSLSFPRTPAIQEVEYHFTPASPPHSSFESVIFNTQSSEIMGDCAGENSYFSLGYMKKYEEGSTYDLGSYTNKVPIATVPGVIKVGGYYYVFKGYEAIPEGCKTATAASQKAFDDKVEALRLALQGLRSN